MGYKPPYLSADKAGTRPAWFILSKAEGYGGVRPACRQRQRRTPSLFRGGAVYSIVRSVFLSSEFNKVVFKLYIKINFCLQCFENFYDSVDSGTISAAFKF